MRMSDHSNKMANKLFVTDIQQQVAASERWWTFNGKVQFAVILMTPPYIFR